MSQSDFQGIRDTMRLKHIKLLQIAQTRGRERGSLAVRTSGRLPMASEEPERTPSADGSARPQVAATAPPSRGPGRGQQQPARSLADIRSRSHGGLLEETQQLQRPTIESMHPPVLRLFHFIKLQLFSPEHPLNKIASNFASHYVDFYSRQILMNNEQFQRVHQQEFVVSSTSAKSGDKPRGSSSRRRSAQGGDLGQEQIVSKDIVVRDLSMTEEELRYRTQLEILPGQQPVQQEQTGLSVPPDLSALRPPSTDYERHQQQPSGEQPGHGEDLRPVNQVSYTLVEKALDEIKEFINIMYGSCIRFYNTLLVLAELEEMKEDLIEKITTMIFYNEGLTELVLSLCKIATQEEEKRFRDRLRESVELDITPARLNVSKYFTLDENSKLCDYYL